jgi:hypothetical protein
LAPALDVSIAPYCRIDAATSAGILAGLDRATGMSERDLNQFADAFEHRAAQAVVKARS